MMPRPKIKELVTDKASFEEWNGEYLDENTFEKFGEYVPFTALNGWWKENDIELYESEKGLIANCNALQPVWPKEMLPWTEPTKNALTDIIVNGGSEKEPVERWVVGQIQLQSTCKKYKSNKGKQVSKFMD